MLNFYRKHKIFASILSIFLLMVSCGTSIQIHACNTEGVQSISIYKFNTTKHCGKCCNKKIELNTILKNNCCKETNISTYFIANGTQTAVEFTLKNKLSDFITSYFIDFKSAIIYSYNYQKVYSKFVLFTKKSTHLLLTKCVLNI